jgi:hypothetical protein
MKTTFIALLTSAALFAFAGQSSQAAPAAPAGVSAGSDIVLVAGGCGRGWHRNHWGRCVRNHPRCWWTRDWRGRPVRVCR